MYSELLSEDFFKDNPYKELSAQKLNYTVLISGEAEENASKYARTMIDDESRAEAIAQEQKVLDNLTEQADIIKYLRKNIDIINRPVLIKKALEHEADIMPAVLKMLLTSDNDRFIENAVRLLAKGGGDYSAELCEMYGQIRSPYVKSMVCIVLGIRGGDDMIPWMLKEYAEMKKQYPDSEDNYSEGPLLALYELGRRFCGA